MNRFSETLTAHSLALRRSKTEVLQVNVGKLCNLTCMHCHVNAGPKRKEIMTRGTIDRVIDWFARTEIPTIDLTGGAPEMIPDFRYFIDQPLPLIYNPVDAFLPGPQAELEADYKRELKNHFGIVFNNLYTITNLPIARFASYLQRNNKLEEYMQLLIDNINPATVSGLMCRNTISVDWTGEVFDCDFNQMLRMNRRNRSGPLHLWDLDPATVENRKILTGNHCFGCTAGTGSSCAGALV